MDFRDEDARFRIAIAATHPSRTVHLLRWRLHRNRPAPETATDSTYEVNLGISCLACGDGGSASIGDKVYGDHWPTPSWSS
jgi:hypothetical protein